MKKTLLQLFAFSIAFSACAQKTEFQQPEIQTKKAETIEEDSYQFKDLNKNGKLDAYEDWRLSTDDRIENLVSLMTVEEKIGLMFHPNIAVTADGVVKYDSTEEEKAAAANAGDEIYAGPIGPGGDQPAGEGMAMAMAMGQMKNSATAKSYIEEKNFRCILNNGIAEPTAFAKWSNSMQEIAENSRLGIPIMFSTDPRHGATLGAHVSGEQYFSQWPSKEGQVGITSARDTSLMAKFGAVVAEEYRAVGLHMILGPQIDVMTEPRWGRNMGCFSEDAELTAEMVGAFIDGAQGSDVGQEKILVHLKHWPGSGPHKGGSGDWLVYPGDNVDYHLIPWKKGIEKGVLAVMGYYSGTYVDSLNVNYSPYWSTDVIYNQLGFKGAICTDWGVASRTGPLKPSLEGKTTLKDNFEMIFNAGVDQIGSDTETELLVELVKEGRVSEARINQAASRILQWHFALGLFENPYVDANEAAQICQSDKNQALGYEAQLKSIVLLDNQKNTLPAKENIKLYVDGIDKETAAKYATIVEKPEDADLILVRTVTTESRGFGGMGMEVQEVNIDFPQSMWNNIKELASTGVPTVVAFNPTGSSVVLPADLKEVAEGSIMIFDALDNALLDIVFGKFNPIGKLSFEVPSSMAAVEKQLEDVPFDSENPMFSFDHGLSY